MNMKSFAMFAMSGLLAASFAYVAPAMAQSSTGSSMQQPAPSDNSQNSGSQNGSGTSQGSDNSMNNDNTNNSNSSSDQGSPDTATGDDDY